MPHACTAKSLGFYASMESNRTAWYFRKKPELSPRVEVLSQSRPLKQAMDFLNEEGWELYVCSISYFFSNPGGSMQSKNMQHVNKSADVSVLSTPY